MHMSSVRGVLCAAAVLLVLPQCEGAKYVEVYKGCHGDVSMARDLSGEAEHTGLYNSPAKCMSFCTTIATGAPFKYFGLQFYRECYCGNTYGAYGIYSDTECPFTCDGDATAKCGGSDRNSVFESVYDAETPAPPTPAPPTPAPPTPAPPTPAPPTPAPPTPAPPTLAPTPSPPTPSPPTPAPPTLAPTPAPPTPAPPTPAPPTLAPTPAPPTPSPPTPAPPTPAPPTPAPPTLAPTPSPPTPSPPTPAPPTLAPTPAPPTPAPPTPAPPTLAPTPAPPTLAPPTPAPPTVAPPTPAPPTPSPVTPAPPTLAPTSVPATLAPPTPAPATAAPLTSAPLTVAPPTLAPATVAPATSAPLTPAPATPAPLTPAPATPAPPTQAPATPAPSTPAPPTLLPATTSVPTAVPTSAPLTAQPTAAPPTQAPATTAPLTAVPTAAPTLAPSTPPATNPPLTNPPLTNPPPTGAPATLPPPTLAPATLAPETQAPETLAPPTLSPATPTPPTAPPATSPPATLPPLTTAPTPAPDTATPLTAAPLYAATYTPLTTDTPINTTTPATYTPTALPATDVPETTVPNATATPDFVDTLNDTVAPPPLTSVADVKVVDLMGFEDSPTTLAVGAASAGAGFSTGAALRLALVSSGCSRDLSTALHPTGLSLDNSKPVGAVAANIAMLATFIAACFVAVPVVRVVGTCLFPTFFKDLDVVGLLRLPSAPVLVFQYFYQGLTLAGMSLVFHPQKGWHAGVGVAILLVCAVVPVVLHLTISQGVPAHGVYAIAEGRKNRALLSLLGKGEWVSMQRDPMWVQRYTVIRPYKQGTTWFLLIEFVSSFTLSAIQSTGPETSAGCGHVKLASGLVFLVLLMLEGLFWPHARSRDAALDILLLGTQLAAMLVMAAGYYTAALDSWLFKVSSKLLTVAFILLVIKITLDILTEVYVITSGRRDNLQEDVLNKGTLLMRRPGGRSLETTQSDSSDRQSDTRAEMRSLLTVDVENGLELFSCTTPTNGAAPAWHETPRQGPVTPTKRPSPHSRGRGRESFRDSRESRDIPTPSLLAAGLGDSFLATEAGSAAIYGGSVPTTGISGRDLEEAGGGGGGGTPAGSPTFLATHPPIPGSSQSLLHMLHGNSSFKHRRDGGGLVRLASHQSALERSASQQMIRKGGSERREKEKEKEKEGGISGKDLEEGGAGSGGGGGGGGAGEDDTYADIPLTASFVQYHHPRRRDSRRVLAELEQYDDAGMLTASFTTSV